MLSVTLFTKKDCGLCEDVKSQLERLASKYPHRLMEIDITQDPEVFKRYRFAIPVLCIGGQTLQAPISPSELVSVLASALSQEDLNAI
jgi:thiol-disulfide isomerase/thioredoxin